MDGNERDEEVAMVERGEPGIAGALGFSETRATNIGAVISAAVSLVYLIQYLGFGPGSDENRVFTSWYVGFFLFLEILAVGYLAVSRIFPGTRSKLARVFVAGLVLWGAALTCLDLQSNMDLSAYAVTIVASCAFLGAPLSFFVPLVLVTSGTVLGAFVLSPLGFDFIDGFVPIVIFAAIALGLAAMRWKERKELFAAWKDIAERTAHLQELSFKDYLTGLYNRRFFVESLDNAIRAARRQKTSLAVAIIDLDHFKRINDSLGHARGDRVLESVARLLDGSKRASDILARYGGEEFVLLFPPNPHDDPVGAMERMAAELRRHSFEAVPWKVTFSAGVAVMREFETVEDLLKRADMALYAAKQAGRDRVVLSQ